MDKRSLFVAETTFVWAGMTFNVASGHSKNCFIVFFKSQNMGVDTIIISLSVILTEL